MKVRWYSLLVICLVFILYFPTLSFAFWRDDWAFYWGAQRLDQLFLTLLYHPGTVAEFLILSRLFGLQFFYWNIFGVFLKILASLSVYRFSNIFMKSRIGGMIAGILFAVSPIGLESVGWPAGHVVLLDTIFCCFCGYYFLEYLKTRSYGIGFMSFSFLIFALASDPIRTGPIIIFFMTYYLCVYTQKISKTQIIRFSLILSVSFVFVLLVLFLNRHFLTDLRIMRAIEKHGIDGAFYVQKILLSIADFFGSIGNMTLGLFGIGYDTVGFSIQSFGNVTIGLLLFAYGIYVSYRAIKKNRSVIPACAILWIFLFYVPNWIFALFNTVGITNRYLVLSSVGFILLVSYKLVHILRSQKALVSVVIIIAIVQIGITYRINAQHREYRANEILSVIQKTMDNEVPKETKQYLFVLTGEGEMFTNGVMMNLQMPFIVYRNIDRRIDFPIMVSDLSSALAYTCGERKTFGAAWEQITVVQKILIEDVYAWRINKEGNIVSIHEEIREKLRASSCKLM